jgi:shikimate kinase
MTYRSAVTESLRHPVGDSVRHVVLMGLMASGKTTVGELLAARLGRPFLDNDVLLEQRTGRTAREIADTDGADALHSQEAEALVAALAAPVPAVIAAAAGAVMEPGAHAALRAYDVVYLRASPAVLAGRLETEPSDGHRPFVAGAREQDAKALLEAQFAARDEPYRAVATLTVDAGRPPEEIAAQISAALEA